MSKLRLSWSSPAAVVRREASRLRNETSSKHQRMLAEAELRRGSRRRALIPTVGGFVLLGTMFQLVSSNILAVNFTTSNSEMKIYSNYLDAQKAAGFLAPSTKQNGSQQGVAEIGILTARLAGLCGIVQESILSLPFSLKITAGDPVPDSFTGTAVPAGVTVDATNGKLNGTSLANSISAQKLFMNSDNLGGFGNKISGLNLGQSADTVAASAGLSFLTDNGGTAPQAGKFGLYADQLNVGGLAAESFGLNLAGDITLPGLKLSVESGSKTQADCSP